LKQALCRIALTGNNRSARKLLIKIKYASPFISKNRRDNPWYCSKEKAGELGSPRQSTVDNAEIKIAAKTPNQYTNRSTVSLSTTVAATTNLTRL